MATLTELRAYEAKLVKAAADPTKQTWFDDFRREMRPFSEIQRQLTWVRAEIAAHPDNTSPPGPRPRKLLIRCGSGF